MKRIDTKKKILVTASAIFTENGYRDTTIRMIADAAKVNVASINYHFGDKEHLYMQVIRFWAEDAFSDFPVSSLEDPSVLPEEKVRLFIYHTLLCLIGKDGQGTGFGRLLTMEAAISPSSIVDQVIADTIGVPTRHLKEAVAQLTGSSDRHEIEVFTACIVGQTVYFYLSRFLIQPLFNIRKPENEKDIKELSDQIYNFCMRALIK